MSKNIRRFMVAIALFWLWFACPPSGAAQAATNYYVATTGSDSATGTSSQPWRTISKAVKMAKPGTTIHVAPGTYNESVWISTSGKPGAPITLVSDQKWGAHIIGTIAPPPIPGANYKPAVDIRGGYINFVNFAVSAPQGDLGIMVTGAHGVASHDRIIGNDVYDVSGPCKRGECSPSHTAGGAGIALSNTTDNLNHDDDVIGNRVHDIGDPLNPQNADLVHGIYIELGGDLEYPAQADYSAKVQNNLIYRIEGDGITSWHCTSHAIVTNNTVFEAGVHGILLSSSYRDCKIGDKGKPNADSVVANNIVVRNGWHAVCAPQIVRAHLCLRKDFGGGCGIAVGHALRARILNNLSNDNRCHSSNSGIIAISDPATARDVASDNIIGIKPLFVNYRADGSGDYHLRSGSPAIDHGTNLDAPSTDFDGTHRPQGAGYDIGAYEYIPGR